MRKPTRKRRERINLGLSLLSVAAREPLTHYDIAAWCDCNVQTIIRLERIALRKLRVRFRFGAWRAAGREMAA